MKSLGIFVGVFSIAYNALHLLSTMLAAFWQQKKNLQMYYNGPIPKFHVNIPLRRNFCIYIFN
jgi:hypothetical protein